MRVEDKAHHIELFRLVPPQRRTTFLPQSCASLWGTKASMAAADFSSTGWQLFASKHKRWTELNLLVMSPLRVRQDKEPTSGWLSSNLEIVPVDVSQQTAHTSAGMVAKLRLLVSVQKDGCWSNCWTGGGGWGVCGRFLVFFVGGRSSYWFRCHAGALHAEISSTRCYPFDFCLRLMRRWPYCHWAGLVFDLTLYSKYQSEE